MSKKIHIKKILVTTILSSLLIFNTTSFAYDKEFFSNNDIVFYSPDACDSGATAGTTVSGKDNAEKIWNFFIGKGMNNTQAAAILGNVQGESDYSPFRHEDWKPWDHPSQGGYGIAQWTGSRRTSIVSKFKEKLPEVHSKYYHLEYGKPGDESTGYIPKGVDQASNDKLLALELEYMFEELNSRRYAFDGSMTEWEALKKAQTIEDTVEILVRSFEVSEFQGEDATKRIGYGKEQFKKMTGSAASPSDNSNNTDTNKSTPDNSKDFINKKMNDAGKDDCDPSGLSANGDVASLQALVKAWAWPTWRGNDTAKMPAYAEAIEKAKNNGGFHGGDCGGGGIDCGGFVTRLMIESGWDPNYYGDGKDRKYIDGFNTGTGGQMKYAEEHWQSLGDNVDPATLKPGDVSIENHGSWGHTFVFVGDIPGFDSKIASASMCQRAPMAGTEPIRGPGIYWYRKK